MVGLRHPDDAAVYRLSAGTALVATLDFFPPIVDDPYDYGAIAAANALSDVYAMGGDPLLALNVLAFPCDVLPEATLKKILLGGSEKAREAGIPIVGGHSVKDSEPKYGLCVIGRVHPRRVVSARGAKAGDALVLTKPLGTGILTTAIKRREASPSQIREVTEVMTALNRGAAGAMIRAGARAATDVTGYGLLGHLRTILHASGVGANLWLENIPLMDGVLDLAAENCFPGGTAKNLAYAETFTAFDSDVSREERLALADAQTSGGLLICVPAGKKNFLLRALRQSKALAACEIGRIVASRGRRVRVLRRHPRT